MKLGLWSLLMLVPVVRYAPFLLVGGSCNFSLGWSLFHEDIMKFIKKKTGGRYARRACFCLFDQRCGRDAVSKEKKPKYKNFNEEELASANDKKERWLVTEAQRSAGRIRRRESPPTPIPPTKMEEANATDPPNPSQGEAASEVEEVERRSPDAEEVNLTRIGSTIPAKRGSTEAVIQRMVIIGFRAYTCRSSPMMTTTPRTTSSVPG